MDLCLNASDGGSLQSKPEKRKKKKTCFEPIVLTDVSQLANDHARCVQAESPVLHTVITMTTPTSNHVFKNKWQQSGFTLNACLSLRFEMACRQNKVLVASSRGRLSTVKMSINRCVLLRVVSAHWKCLSKNYGARMVLVYLAFLSAVPPVTSLWKTPKVFFLHPLKKKTWHLKMIFRLQQQQQHTRGKIFVGHSQDHVVQNGFSSNDKA